MASLEIILGTLFNAFLKIISFHIYRYFCRTRKSSFLKKSLQWKSLIRNKGYLRVWIVSLFTTLAVLVIAGLYLCYNETRTNGVVLNDYVLANILPRDISSILFPITWICILGSLPILLRTPNRAMRIFWGISVIGIIRCVVMYLVPLEPPIGIIPLRDPFVEGAFYDNKVLVKDLFFSGHTSNMVLLTLFMDIKWLKIILAFAATTVGYLVLVQHVHYTIDVIAAPFFAYLAYRIATKIADHLVAKFHGQVNYTSS